MIATHSVDGVARQAPDGGEDFVGVVPPGDA